jgi:eukaryotic-like serine/threonine-protein kinase
MNCPQCGHDNPAETTRCSKCHGALATKGGSAGISTSGWSSQAPAEGATSAFVSSSTIQIGTLLGGRYEILQLLGEGGMGAVYKAQDRAVDRLVALKVIRAELAYRPEILKRFKQELILARQITHKNVIRIFDLGEAEGIKFISMDFVEGQDLKSMVREKGKLNPEEARNIVVQVCRALNAAHAEGVIHRDLKPQNIMVSHDGQVTVMDFGIARSMETPGLTTTGMVVGTPEYMSPEQGKGETVDGRSDIYSLGVIFYELLTGQTPHHADTALAIMLKRTQEIPRPPRDVDPTIPNLLNRAAMKCLEIDASKRYQTARAILEDLEARTTTRTALTAAAPAVGWKDILRAHKIAAAVALAVVLLLGTGLYVVRNRLALRPPAKVKTVTLLVSDFDNQTHDAVFDGTLEPMMEVALEGASFINAYKRPMAHKIAAEIKPGATGLDEPLARLVAVRQGIPVVVGGKISQSGDTYTVSVDAVDANTGKTLVQKEANAKNKNDVLGVVGKLAAGVRKALGDKTPESVQIEETRGALTASSLEVVHEYGVAQEQQFAGKVEESLRSFAKAAELDPNFAHAYAGMASSAIKLGRMQDAEKYINLAMEHVDRMTDRERYRVRGLYYGATGNWQKCAEEYGELVKRYPGDNIGHNNLAVCLSEMRNLPGAVEEARRDLENNPNATARANLAVFSCYAGDFESGEREAKNVQQLNPAYEYGYLAQAFAQLGQGQLPQAAETYQKLEKLSARGASSATLGLGDLALYEGRFADAVRILEQGAAADLAAKNPDSAADKLVALAYAQLLRGQKEVAVAAAEKALANSNAAKIRFLAARIFVEAGEAAKAEKLGAGLASELQVEPQAYAKIIEGMVAVKRGDTRQGMTALTEANKLFNTWIGHFELGRAYLEAGAFVEADSEFDECIKRRGEVLALFLDEAPTYGYFPPVYYYQGRAREGLKSPGFADSYRTYLNIRGQAGEDPLLTEIHRRIGQ